MVRSLILVLAVLVLLPTAASSNIIFTVAEGASGSVDLTILASGKVTTNGGLQSFLTIGTVGDTFLSDQQSLISDETADPDISLGGTSVSTFHFYTDRNTGLNNFGVDSNLRFNFSDAPGAVDLAALNGVYNFDDWVFSDFNPGTYELTEAVNSSQFMTGLGTLSLVVVPEPSTALLLASGLALLAARQRD